MGDDLVCLDAGHGGRDSGSVSELGPEKEYTLVQTLVAESVLLAEGLETVLTRRTDEYVSLRERVALANEAGAACFVSYHWNYAGSLRPSGTLTLHWKTSERGRGLAERLLEEVAPLDGEEDERWERVWALPDAAFRTNSAGEPFEPYVLRETVMPAVIVEVEFGSNPDDARRMMEPQYHVDVARATARAVNGWLADETRAAEATSRSGGAT